MSTENSGELVPVLLHHIYVEELRTHAVALISMGYQQLNATAFSTAEEDVITGELVRAMKIVVQNPDSPQWVDHYHVCEQVPQNVDDKCGKRRPKIDIEIERCGRGQRPRLSFEAKRLGGGCKFNLGNYLGEKGLDAFLTGYYPTTHGEAGMLGYIQENTPEYWTSQICTELTKNPSKYQTPMNREWQIIDSISASHFCYTHTLIDNEHLLVLHILLPFKI